MDRSEKEVRRSLLNIDGPHKPDGSAKPKDRLTRPLVIVAFFAAIGNSFNHGYNTGVLNNPSQHIKTFLNNSFESHYGDIPTEDTINLLWSFTNSIYLIGGCAGAFSAGFFADKFGRKTAILMMAAPGLVGDLLFGFCQMANSLEMLFLGRLIIGFSCGAGSGLVPMYLTEISPVSIRGAMGVIHQLALTCGILVAQLLGLSQLLGSESLWPLLLASSAVPYILCCISLPWFPDSPLWYLEKTGDEQRVVQIVQRFRGREDVGHDIQEMKDEAKAQQAEPAWTMKKLFRSKSLQIPLMLVSVLGVTQQLSGINMVFYYSDDVFKSVNIGPYAQYATLGIGIINVIMTIISVFLVEKAGRRPLLIGGMIGMIISLIVMTVALNLATLYPWVSYISVVFMVLFVVCFAIGLGPIPQFIGAELFKQGPRPAAMSFAGLMNWVANFIVAMSFPHIQKSTGPYCMLFFIAFLSVFGFVIWKYLPETKNKSFDEIAALMGIKTTDENKKDASHPLTEMNDVPA